MRFKRIGKQYHILSILKTCISLWVSVNIKNITDKHPTMRYVTLCSKSDWSIVLFMLFILFLMPYRIKFQHECSSYIKGVDVKPIWCTVMWKKISKFDKGCIVRMQLLPNSAFCGYFDLIRFIRGFILNVNFTQQYVSKSSSLSLAPSSSELNLK